MTALIVFWIASAVGIAFGWALRAALSEARVEAFAEADVIERDGSLRKPASWKYAQPTYPAIDADDAEMVA